MKTPRITDFDPDAKIPTLKSSLDSMPSIQKPPSSNHLPIHQTRPLFTRRNEQQQEQKQPNAKLSTSKPATPLAKRPYVRRTFDFFEDQITYLTRHSLQERLQGREISMNEMVREALDDWINKITTKK